LYNGIDLLALDHRNQLKAEGVPTPTHSQPANRSMVPKDIGEKYVLDCMKPKLAQK